MTIRKFHLSFAVGFIALSCGLATDSKASAVFEPMVKLVSPDTASLCSTELENISCTNFSLASVIGSDVEKVISGKIVDRKKFSWIAQTEENNYLCVANTIDDVICKDMEFKKTRSLELDFVGSGDKGRFVFSYPWNDEKSQKYLRSAVDVFQIKYLRALTKIDKAITDAANPAIQKSALKDIISTNSCGNEIQCDADDNSIPVVIIDAPYPDPEPGPWVGGSITFPPIGGGGGGGGGAGGDGTAGTSMAFNRGPQCERENDFMNRTMAQVYLTGKFVGTQVPIVVTDPYYGDGQWIKIQEYQIEHSYKTGDPYRLQFRLNMHYMYNVTTGQPHQTKLKNSFEAGCQGFKMAP